MTHEQALSTLNQKAREAHQRFLASCHDPEQGEWSARQAERNRALLEAVQLIRQIEETQ